MRRDLVCLNYNGSTPVEVPDRVESRCQWVTSIRLSLHLDCGCNVTCCPKFLLLGTPYHYKLSPCSDMDKYGPHRPLGSVTIRTCDLVGIGMAFL